MAGEWFDSIAAELRARVAAAGPLRMEFVAGVRVNGAPHIGTYLTLASVFVYASRAAGSFGLPCTVRIHFLDNDPAPDTGDRPATHFRCVFQTRTAEEGERFIRDSYASFLQELSTRTGCPYETEVYSVSQGRPEFRSLVLQSLREWNNIKYYVSGPPLITTPTGVRGLGFPCPECGLFNARLRPSIDLLTGQSAVLTSECCNHGEYRASLTPFNSTYVNLETAYRNVIKEMLAAKDSGCLSIMMKGTDWRDGLRYLDLILGLLGVPKTDILPRFLVPVVQTESGIKLSKSAILLHPGAFKDLPPLLLDMRVLREESPDYAARILGAAEAILASPALSSGTVPVTEVRRMLEKTKKRHKGSKTRRLHEG